jgi:hypothetical protein
VLYDAMLHAVFLGFVISMVFAHASVIFPAVLGLPFEYRPAFYLHERAAGGHLWRARWLVSERNRTLTGTRLQRSRELTRPCL